MGVPILVRSMTDARQYAALLRDLLTRVVPGASGAVSLAGAVDVSGNLVVGGTASVAGAASVGGLLTATGGLTAGGPVVAAGGLVVGGTLHPATPTGAGQTAVSVHAGTGAPSNGDGANGDFYFRSDGGAGTSVYHKTGGAWAGRA